MIDLYVAGLYSNDAAFLFQEVRGDGGTAESALDFSQYGSCMISGYCGLWGTQLRIRAGVLEKCGVMLIPAPASLYRSVLSV